MAIDVNAFIAVTVAPGQPDETPRRTPDQLLPSGRTTVLTLSELATLIGVGGGGAGTFIQIEDQKASSTSGGTFTSGARRRRDLNTIVRDDTGSVTLDTNKFTIPEGEYKISARVPGNRVAGHVAVLVRDPDGSPSDIFASPGEISNSSDATQTVAHIAGFFLVGSGGEEFAIEHQCQVTKTTNGLGQITSSFGIDNDLCRYTIIELEKIV